MTHSGNDDSEQELIRLIRQGDGLAMKTLYCRTVEYLTAVCSRYVIDEDDVRDVLQDSFIKIFTAADKFEYRGEGSLKAWMARIVVNESLKFLKRREKFEAIQYEDDLQDGADEEEPDTKNIPAAVIQEMIRQLPTGYRAVFNLYVIEGKSHREIASLLKIKESTSASQLHRAKDMLAKRIHEYTNTAV